MAGNGKDNFDKNMAKAMKQMRLGAIKGLRLGVALIKGESMRNAPVDSGNLKGSHYTAFQVNRDNAVGEVGSTANYAAAVHEIEKPSSGVPRAGKDGKGNYWDTGGPKYLETAIEDKKKDVHKLIQKHAKIS